MNQYSRDLPLKKVGKEVFFLQTDDETVRCGEGAFLRLKDGAILHAYTEYYQGNIRDHGKARIAALISRDEGETWERKGVLLPCPEDAVNLMSVSLLRLDSGEILIFYLKKTEEYGDKVLCRPMVRSSFDECESFGEERCCVKKNGIYYILNNDRARLLQDGRILLPVACKDKLKGTAPEGEAVRFVVSCDQGKSWEDLGIELKMPFENLRGFEEPGIYQHEDGEIWCYFRTNLGCQFETGSVDGGKSWTRPRGNIFFTSPRSPMLICRACGKTLSVFNPIPLYTGRNLGGIRGRAPYFLAVSDTDGQPHDQNGFSRLYLLEDDFDNDYSYPAHLDLGDSVLFAYYHSNGRERPLNCLKIIKVKKEEIL